MLAVANKFTWFKANASESEATFLPRGDVPLRARINGGTPLRDNLLDGGADVTGRTSFAKPCFARIREVEERF